MSGSLKVGDVVLFSYAQVCDLGLVVKIERSESAPLYDIHFFDPDTRGWEDRVAKSFLAEDLTRIGNVEEWGRGEFDL